MPTRNVRSPVLSIFLLPKERDPAEGRTEPSTPNLEENVSLTNLPITFFLPSDNLPNFLPDQAEEIKEETDFFTKPDSQILPY